VKLREVVYVDFRKSEWTLYREWERTHTGVKLKADEVICMISYSRDIVLFVHPTMDIDPGDGRRKRQVVASQKVRVRGGACDLRMLSYWADAAGIVLDGIKRYEEYWGYLDTFDEGRRTERAKPKDPLVVTTTGKLTSRRKRRKRRNGVSFAAHARRPR
jgi:hypothetical protein